MKKGAFGAILGIVVFYIAISLIIESEGLRIASFMPFIFIILFSIGVPFITKKAKELQKDINEKGNSYNRYSDSKYGGTLSSKTNCHKCNSVIDKSYNYCPNCGASQRDTVICEYCGHENPKGNALCEKCNGFL